jgi:two-component system, response regulator PdtaR
MVCRAQGEVAMTTNLQTSAWQRQHVLCQTIAIDTELRLRILVIEDDPLIAMLVADTLTGMGHSICAIARNEKEAVSAASKHCPDLMIVDARLGRESGIVAVNEIIKTCYIPHVFVTGDKHGVMALRPDAIVVEKPFLLPELTAAIDRAMLTLRAQ